MRWGGATVEISFSDARLCAIFNSIDGLRKRYGKSVAQSIAIRMAVLASAPSLAHVPQRPPIGLKSDGSAFTVDLVDGKRVLFEPATSLRRRTTDLDVVTRITILGVEP